jgi:transcriptional regulator with XRE-family HTH domain
LRALREAAGLNQRELGKRLQKPQSWVYNCETANRRVDVTEFIAWAEACEVSPQAAFARFLQSRS